MRLHDTPCPDSDCLKGLLDGSMSGDRQAEVTGHLDECPPCQQALEELAAGNDSLAEALRHVSENRPASKSAYWHAVAQLEKEVAQNSAATVLSPAVQTDTDVALDFLTPSDEPGMLGRLGDFEVVEVIGRGGMGLVLKGYDGCLQRHIALKVLDPNMAKNETARQRFCREARSAAAITHANVMAVYQVNEDEKTGLPFLVMQLVTGESLQERLDREGKLEVRDVLRIGVQTAMGLAAAHSRGLIHRDIKPANILLEENNHVLLTDFGLARALSDVKLTQTGFVAGTPLYMSPEQARDEEVDHRSDLFSLGGVLYAMATGQAPFAGSTPYLILKKVTEEAPRPVREVNPAVPAGLAAVIEKLLAKNPADRYQSASEVIEGLVQQFCMASTSGPAAAPAVPAPRSEVVPLAAGDLRVRRRTLAVAVPALLVGGMLLAQVGGVRRVLAPEPRAAGPDARATLPGNSGPVWSVAFDRDGKTVAMAIDDGTVKLWDWDELRVKATIDAHQTPVWSVAFSPDGKFLATASDDGTARLWDAATGLEQAAFKHETSVRSLAFAPDGCALVTGSRDGSVRVWDVDKPEPRLKTKGHAGVVMAVAFSPDGKSIASAGGDKFVKLWDAQTGQEQLKLAGHAGGVYAVAFAPDGKSLASGGWDQTVRLWEVNSGKELAALHGHAKDVWSVAFAPDGKTLASASEDETVKVWDPASGRELATLRGHTRTLYAVAFSRDGSAIASGGRDGTVKLWDAPVR